jgi:hypothetical protein
MRDLAYPFMRCVQCEGIALSPRRLCSHCEAQEAMTKATIRGRCTHCKDLTVLTHHNLHQGEDGRYTLICENCEERG